MIAHMSSEPGNPQKEGFALVLQTNEVTKLIDANAQEIRLNALNSLILASKSGNQAAGFAAVTQEFIRFSGQLTEHSEKLSGHLREMVRTLSERIKTETRGNLFIRAYDHVQEHSSLLEEVTRTREQAQMQWYERTREQVEQLRKMLTETRGLLKRGNKLAVQAKVQAATSGEHRDDFARLSEQARESLQSVISQADELEALVAARRQQNEGEV